MGSVMSDAVALENITVGYGRQVAIHDVHAHFETGSLTAVAGPNGSGKSTLLKAIAGILKPSKGHIHIDPALKNHIAYLPQTSFIRRDFPMPVLQAVCCGFWKTVGEGRTIDHEMEIRARAALAEVGLENLEDRQIGSLSGGQFQRVLFARTIVEDAKIILLDEPFTAVDAETTARLINVILDWHKQGRTVICVMHDLMLIRKYFPESVVLAGRCIGRGHTHDMFRQKLLSFDLDMAELYTDGKDIPAPRSRPCDHDGHDHA